MLNHYTLCSLGQNHLEGVVQDSWRHLRVSDFEDGCVVLHMWA